MVHDLKIRQDFAKRLALAARRAGLSEHGRGSTMAKQLGVSPKAVSKWFNAETMPRLELMQHLATFLQVDPIWLQMGPYRELANNAPVDDIATGKYPLIDWDNAERWCSADTARDAVALTEWFVSDTRIQGHAFWLRVQGDVMSSPVGLSLSEGMIVLVDPGRKAENGNLVVATRVGEGGITLRKLVLEGWQRFLTPLNPVYPITAIEENVRIIGVVVEAKIQFT